MLYVSIYVWNGCLCACFYCIDIIQTHLIQLHKCISLRCVYGCEISGKMNFDQNVALIIYVMLALNLIFNNIFSSHHLIIQYIQRRCVFGSCAWAHDINSKTAINKREKVHLRSEIKLTNSRPTTFPTNVLKIFSILCSRQILCRLCRLQKQKKIVDHFSFTITATHEKVFLRVTSEEHRKTIQIWCASFRFYSEWEKKIKTMLGHNETQTVQSSPQSSEINW